MKAIIGSRRHHYVARVSIFLIIVALIAGMLGCNGGGVIEFEIDPDTGEILETTTFTSPDGMLTVTIPEGTIALDKDGNPLTTLRVDNDPDLPALPEDAHIIGLAQDFAPSEATFDPPMTLTWKYNPADIPEDVDEEDLVIAYYDEAAGEWVIVESVVDTATNTVTASVSHLSAWCLISLPISLVQYDLTITSTAGGSVTTPGEGTFTYHEGTAVNLVAEAEEGYQFVNWTGDVGTIAGVNDATTTITMNGDYSITANFERTFMVTAGWGHTVGLKHDGTVVAVGYNDYGQRNVGSWTDVVQVAGAGGGDHTVGLMSDGRVVAVGRNDHGQCNVGSWTDIIQVAGGGLHTVGLRSDGTVVAVGYNYYGECNVAGWTDIIEVAAGWRHTVGLMSDGTVVAVGDNGADQCNVGGWTDIVQVAGGGAHTVGLMSDGIVVAVGYDTSGQINVGGWTNIVQVAAGGSYTVGLKSNGTAVAAGGDYYGECNVTGWTDIVQVAAGQGHTVGLKSDGTVVAVGNNPYGQCNVGGWMLRGGGESYTLTISSNTGGSVTTPGEGTSTYNQGTEVNLVATPDADYQFDNWTGDVDTIADVNAATTTITMNSNYSITANFKPRTQGQFELTISSTEGGSVTTPGEGTFTYIQGTVVNLVATPDDGYRFDNWTGDMGTIANVNAATTTITMNGDYSITANFVTEEYALIWTTYGLFCWSHSTGVDEIKRNSYSITGVIDIIDEGEYCLICTTYGLFCWSHSTGVEEIKRNGYSMTLIQDIIDEGEYCLIQTTYGLFCWSHSTGVEEIKRNGYSMTLIQGIH